LAALGCQSGYPPAEIETAQWNDDVASHTAQMKSLAGRTRAARDLQGRLLWTEAGRVLINGIEAHGGWDAWIRLPSIRYSRARATQAPTTEDTPPGAERRVFDLSSGSLVTLYCPCSPEPHPPHFEPLPESSASDAAVADEFFLLTLPFSLQDPALLKEYLGVEEDLSEALLFEKVRFTWPTVGGETRLVAWFDRTAGVLRRVLLRRADGKLTLVIFSEWTGVAGVQIPTRREMFSLARTYSQWDRAKPANVDVLSSFEERDSP
jgi:hypothetical protein